MIEAAIVLALLVVAFMGLAPATLAARRRRRLDRAWRRASPFGKRLSANAATLTRMRR